MTKALNLSWHGMLTVKNIEQVAALLRALLDGKRFVFVTANECYDFKPEIRLSQVLVANATSTAIKVSFGDERQYASLDVHDSYGAWTLSTDLREEGPADREFRNPYVSFEGDRVTITHRAGAGNKIHWLIAVQKEEA